MKLSSLRNFIVITRCGSFTKASEQLLISQPTLSRQIMDLEQELGVSLYERTKDGLQLSEAGETLMVEAVEIVERCDRLSRLFHPAAESRKVTHEVLKIGFQTFFNIEDLRAILDRFRVTETETEIYCFRPACMSLSTEYSIIALTWSSACSRTMREYRDSEYFPTRIIVFRLRCRLTIRWQEERVSEWKN